MKSLITGLWVLAKVIVAQPADAKPLAVTKVNCAVYFSANSEHLPPAQKKTLTHWVSWLNAHPTQDIVLNSYSDAKHTQEYSLSISERLGNEVLMLMKKSGLTAEAQQHVTVLARGKYSGKAKVALDSDTCLALQNSANASKN